MSVACAHPHARLHHFLLFWKATRNSTSASASAPHTGTLSVWMRRVAFCQEGFHWAPILHDRQRRSNPPHIVYSCTKEASSTSRTYTLSLSRSVSVSVSLSLAECVSFSVALSALPHHVALIRQSTQPLLLPFSDIVAAAAAADPLFLSDIPPPSCSLFFTISFAPLSPSPSLLHTSANHASCASSASSPHSTLSRAPKTTNSLPLG